MHRCGDGESTNEQRSVVRDDMPDGVCFYCLSSPLTFVGLPRFVSEIISVAPDRVRVVIINIEENALASESDLAVVANSADRLFARAILPMLVLPKRADRIRKYFRNVPNVAIFSSAKTALDRARDLLLRAS